MDKVGRTTTRERAEVMKRMKLPQGLDERQILFWYQSYCCRADNLVADLLAENDDVTLRLQIENDEAAHAWAVARDEHEALKAENAKFKAMWPNHAAAYKDGFDASQQAAELRIAESVRVTAEEIIQYIKDQGTVAYSNREEDIYFITDEDIEHLETKYFPSSGSDDESTG